MKVTIFSSNQPRHLNLAKQFSQIADQVFLISEVNTVFPGQVADFICFMLINSINDSEKILSLLLQLVSDFPPTHGHFSTSF
tara:strand:- start:472 stop:717 length:246 start_codon:yes stop_codon:yes gene_type:complete